MSVAGLKKQFHKASQVRGAGAGAGAATEPRRGASLLAEGSPHARLPAAAGSSTSAEVAASLSGTSVLPSALPLAPPCCYCRLASGVDPCQGGLPVSFLCLGLGRFLLVIDVCDSVLGLCLCSEASVKDTGCRVLAFPRGVVVFCHKVLFCCPIWHTVCLSYRRYRSRVFPSFLDALLLSFLGEPSSAPDPLLSCSL